MQDMQRFKFISNALNGTGGFRPTVTYDVEGRAIDSSFSYLVRYSRESIEKYSRRNDVAFFTAPLKQATSRFEGYLSSKKTMREYPQDLYTVMADDIDGKGNSIGVFMRSFVQEAKARGSMLLLVDMPRSMAENQQEQIERRVAPYWTPIFPESVTDWETGDDGKFLFCKFSGTYIDENGDKKACEWYFDRMEWAAYEGEKKIDGDVHGLGDCPVLIFTEAGDFPCFGSFSFIADLSRRLFNLESELDEILRAQTFSLLTLQAPENSTAQEKLDSARVAGETIGSSNLMVHSGAQPSFIAPPDGPARVYIDRISAIKQEIDQIALNVATINEQESGVAMQMRFHAINSELAAFAAQMEDMERRAWDLSSRWLGLSVAPEVEWQRDFDIADVQGELDILSSMQATAMPGDVVVAQQKRIVSVQFAGMGQESLDEMMDSFDEMEQELSTETDEAVEPLDSNSELRSAVVSYLNNG